MNNSRKAILAAAALGALFGAVGSTARANTLGVGDIFVTGSRTDSPDTFAIVPFVGLDAGTVISFTDDSYTGSTFTTTENIATWTVPTGGIAAGTVVVFSDPGSGNESVDAGGTTSGRLSGLSASGDQVFIYQGTLNGADQTLIFGFNIGNAGWRTAGASDSNTSYLPSVLNVTNGNIDLGPTSTFDNADYTGSRSNKANLADYKAELKNVAANWTFDDVGSTLATISTTDFSVTETPEPTSLGLLGLLGALATFHRRRQA